MRNSFEKYFYNELDFYFYFKDLDFDLLILLLLLLVFDDDDEEDDAEELLEDEL